MAGKHVQAKARPPKKRRSVSWLLVLAAAAALVTAIGGTMAWLTSESSGLTNTFTPAEVQGEILENFTDTSVKKDVKVKNTGDVAAYVRVALVPTWVDEKGKPVAEPVVAGDVTIDGGNWTEFTPGSDWLRGSDGYYYYTSPVPADGTTSNLFDSATVNNTTNGYQMNLQILLQMIQADGTTDDGTKPVVDAWGVTLNDTTITGVGADNSGEETA